MFRIPMKGSEKTNPSFPAVPGPVSMPASAGWGYDFPVWSGMGAMESNSGKGGDELSGEGRADPGDAAANRRTKTMTLNGSKTTSSRFTPGRGLIPPYLAGREYEQALLREQYGIVAAGERVPADVVLVGPRGNGKTALLRWFENTIGERGGADVVWVTPTRIPSVAAMAEAFAPSAIPGKGTLRASLGLLSGEWTLDGERHGDLASLLIARCRRRPLVVLLDEAHTLDLEVGRALLNASQEVGSEAPFLLCLAGTPGLTAHLSRMGASFVGRSEELRIRLLDRAAAEAALVEPLKASGIAIEPEALAAVIDESQRYPYFVQVWGERCPGPRPAPRPVSRQRRWKPRARHSIGYTSASTWSATTSWSRRGCCPRRRR